MKHVQLGWITLGFGQAAHYATSRMVAFVYMANKKVGGSYFIVKEEHGYKRGEYFFAGYTKCCARKFYLDHYQAQEFVDNAKPDLWQPPLFQRILKMIPLPKVSFETAKEKELKSKYQNV